MNVYLGLDTGALSIGAQSLIDGLEKLAKQSGGTLIQTGGRGLYHLEPLVEIQADSNNQTHDTFAGGITSRHAFYQVSIEDIPQLVTNNQPNTNHPKYAGLVADLPELACQSRFTFCRAGWHNPLDFSAWQKHGGGQGIAKATALSSQQAIDVVKASGLRGRGGAGFPTGIKWQTVYDASATPKYIVCNADEGDSGTFADRLLIESDPFTLIEGMVIAAYAVGASKGFIYLRSEYPLAIERMTNALSIALSQGLLGAHALGKGVPFTIEIRRGAGAYICGEETSLLESLEGKRGTIRYKPPLPAIEGAFGKPTVLNNVITLATIAPIFANGAQSYATMGYGKSRGTLTVQLAGNVRRGGLYELPFGITLQQLVMDIGGGTQSGKPVRAVQVGGPLGAYFPPTLFTTPLDYESFSAQNGLIGHGGVVVFDESINLAEQAEYAFRFCAHESCGKCTPCRIGSTRGAELIQQMTTSPNASQLELITDLCELMEQTSLCALGGMTPYPVKSALKYFPQDFGLDDATSS